MQYVFGILLMRKYMIPLQYSSHNDLSSAFSSQSFLPAMNLHPLRLLGPRKVIPYVCPVEYCAPASSRRG